MTDVNPLCRLLLQQMAPEHRFETGARLTREVVAAFCDGALSLQESPEVLHDALAILGSKDIKVRFWLWSRYWSAVR